MIQQGVSIAGRLKVKLNLSYHGVIYVHSIHRTIVDMP